VVKKMRELSHPKHRYEGVAGEQVTIKITANGTTHMVHFVLDGASAQVLPAGTPLRFNLKNSSGDVTLLQLTMDFNGEGSYDIVVANVENCPTDPLHIKCTHTRNGPPRVIENHKYFVA
jgi:hypothetical protein